MDDIEHLAKQVFGEEKVSSRDSSERTYPEHILHESTHATRYYNAFQQHTRQFVPSGSHVVRFSHSALERLSQEKVAAWDTETGITSRPGTSAALFSWSSSDKSVAARRRELEGKTRAPQNSLESKRLLHENSHSSQNTASATHNLAHSPKNSHRSTFAQRLALQAERESNRFVQQRIQVIKEHHLRAASKKVDERKRRDHESHVQRIRQKEEAYERALKAAIEEQSSRRSSGLFASLFGSPRSASFTFEPKSMAKASYSAENHPSKPLEAESSSSSLAQPQTPSRTASPSGTQSPIQSPGAFDNLEVLDRPEPQTSHNFLPLSAQAAPQLTDKPQEDLLTL
ncbi:hypothetical protein FOB63_003030 [Clavispora lusitaniae]|uniref:Uncharacterized protein n=1 Tax=Clavispora lusitaniae (strain ATCC 42720) TaxID=306902 RepID=C4Y9D1_CLAL4|nr:uncharacterized protein CLUG_04809 [Clavispora lusitaniae ATCC 42720]EEQ40681.1 hypothetical protein CLUG_04809 [Clavispora lusitaniae ATCC 42720]KAF5209399.1 hypothetical protein E0198_003699 [Clavispora lusitaniae]KAF7581407.1 hypothetical protein FOB63_003030 [Clavispora lusitaniae]